MIPNKLNQGDKVAIVATARAISKEELGNAVDLFESWGLDVVFGDNLFKIDNQFAGDDFERASDFQDMIDNNEVKAIFCARGGYGTARIVDNINFSNLKNNPKWIIGYSDVTSLHTHLNNLQISTLHATMPINIPLNTKSSLESLHSCLFNNSNSISCDSHLLNREGVISGEIVGGNLSVLYSLIGSPSDLDTNDKILFLEDLDEYLYHIDRMILNLKRNKKFSKLKGLIVGKMKGMHDNTIPFGKTANEIIYNYTREFNFPICFEFPSGHIKNNSPLIFNKNTLLKIENTGVTLIQ